MNDNIKYNQLTLEEQHVILEGGTETPFTGSLLNNKEDGTYICKRCNAQLFDSSAKFDSKSGWPSFDESIEWAIEYKNDGDRTEIRCANCGGHLGHVFYNEGFTDKNARYCVNSLSLNFTPVHSNIEYAYFASGCFWGTEYWFEKANGVEAAVSGYAGGDKDYPTYQDVRSGTTGHLETVRVEYDPNLTTYEELVKLFFETHDYTQANGQGPDIGNQYLSAIFYSTEEEKLVIKKYINILKSMGKTVATTVREFTNFYPAEEYHQDYYAKNNATPYCHFYTKIF